MKKLKFEKMNGLLPTIIQDSKTNKVLMFGYMNKESSEKTIKTNLVTFYSRTKKRLWTKGEESKNFLNVVKILPDCDNDTLLILANPQGPTCHTGKTSCFGIARAENETQLDFIDTLYTLLKNRKKKMPKNSYTTKLFTKGIDTIVQKIGEEATEVVIAGKNESQQRIIEESCDLLYHLLVLFAEKKISLEDIMKELKRRHP